MSVETAGPPTLEVEEQRSEWLEQQRLVFAKWTAMTLEHRETLNLREAFADPVTVYDLAAKLAKRPLPFKRPRTMTQRPRMVKLQELNRVLEFFQNDGVHITCAGDDLERGKEKLIMGLIWTLILKYQIEDKKKVFEWCQQVCTERGIEVSNLTRHWQSGQAFAAVVHAIDQSLINMDAIKQGKPATNLQTAFDAGEKLGIPAMIEVDYLLDHVPDERLVVTYLSYFYRLATSPPPPKPEPVPVAIECNHQAEIDQLREQMEMLTKRLRDKTKKYNSLVKKTNSEMRFLVEGHKTLMDRMKEVKAKNAKMEKKLKEIALKLPLAAEGAQNVVPAPEGEIAILETYIAGSAVLWDLYPEEMGKAMQIHNRVVRCALKAKRGYEAKYEGGSFQIVFQKSLDAIAFAFEVQVALTRQRWPTCFDTQKQTEAVEGEGGPFRGLRVGIALSFGSCPMQEDPVSGKTSYFGPTVAQTKALLRLVAGGQVLATRAFMDSVDTKEMTIVGEGYETKELGDVEVGDAEQVVAIYQILPAPLKTRVFPPLISSNNAEQATQALAAELEAMRKENEALQSELKNMEVMAHQATKRASELESWFRQTQSKKATTQNEEMLNAAREAGKLINEQQKLRDLLEDYKRRLKESEEYMGQLNSELGKTVRMVKHINKSKKELAEQNVRLEEEVRRLQAELDRLAKSPRRVEVVTSEHATLEQLRAPEEVMRLVSIYPVITVARDHETEGNWIIGDHSYTLQDIAALRVDGTDLLETEAERRVAREKRARKQNRKHRHSVFGGWGRSNTHNRIQRDSPAITRRPTAAADQVELEGNTHPLRRSHTDPTLVEASASSSASASSAKSTITKESSNSAVSTGKAEKADDLDPLSKLQVSQSLVEVSRRNKEKKKKSHSGSRVRKSHSKPDVVGQPNKEDESTKKKHHNKKSHSKKLSSPKQ
mmetsp:Transcript_40621/g.102247  ORF Transcript_40621/g.102247 Transcript_40621/m.102247 type:complete len:941 (-) Transcript_40621:10-2832(-)